MMLGFIFIYFLHCTTHKTQKIVTIYNNILYASILTTIMIVTTLIVSLLVGVTSAHSGPIWGHGEDWVNAKLGNNKTQTCILGTQTGCSTSVCNGLTNQIVNKLDSMGYSFSTLDSNWIHCASPCVNKLQTSAANSLASAAKSKNDYITLNSAFRSSAQQYLLYQWYNKGIW
jgi:hypothetical protein